MDYAVRRGQWLDNPAVPVFP